MSRDCSGTGLKWPPAAAAPPFVLGKTFSPIAGNPGTSPHVNIGKVFLPDPSGVGTIFYGVSRQSIEKCLWKCFLLDVRSDFLKLASLHLCGGVIINQHGATLKERSCKFALNVKTP